MYRCLGCRTRRKSWAVLLKHMNQAGHRACTCGGYHFKHRPGSPCCVHNIMADVYPHWLHGDVTDEEFEAIKQQRLAEQRTTKDTDDHQDEFDPADAGF